MNKNVPVVKRLVDANDTILTVEDVAEILGISPWGVRKRINRGHLPAHRQGRRLYVLKSELVADIRNN